MDKTSQQQLMTRLLQTFAGEADERLQAMNRELLMLEGTTEEESIKLRLESLFREAHSLKGAARAVNAERVERVAHRLESTFELMRRGELAPVASVCDVVYRVLDGLGQLAHEATSHEPAAVDVDGLMAMLDRPDGGVVEQTPAAPGADAAAPPARTAPSPPPTPATAPPPAPPHPQRPPRATSAALASDSVRVPIAKLDALLADAGELSVAQAGALQHLQALRALGEELGGWEAASRRQRAAGRRRRPGLQAATHAGLGVEDSERLRATRKRVVEVHRLLEASGRQVAQAAAGLEDEVRRSRMLPVSSILDAFPRMVRDIAREQDKQVALIVNGADTEVDRSLLEEMRAPLTHVVRNSIDHGIERAGDRVAAGKPANGSITVSVHQRGGTLSVDVADDGAGIDLAQVRAKAVERGLIPEEAAGRMSDREALGLIYRSGFSTAAMITDLSGRGVGLDVVREHVERLHGMIDVDASAGKGTRFTFVLPLSVSTTPCLLVHVAGRSFALPVTNASRIVRVASREIRSVEGAAVVRDEEDIIALADLADVLGIERGDLHPVQDPSPAILLGSADRRMAFLVDDLVDLQNVVTKGLPAPLHRVRHLAGATILSTGEVIPILNAADVIRSASPQREEGRGGPDGVPRGAVVLLVEDSITTRALEKNILEAAGYEVRAVGDGLEAWSVLQQGGIDLVVSDVYMSGMDGFELTAMVRADDRLARLPVVLVTSKDSRSHRERGAQAGADAYIVKGSFEQQNLVDAVARLL